MKWILGYAVGAVVLLAPVGVRLLMRSEPMPQTLAESAVSQGKMLFTHEWTVNDPLCPTGDGLGPVYNGTSCAQCHHQGGVGGSGTLDNNVTTFANLSARRGRNVSGVIHAHAISADFQENLSQANGTLPCMVRPTLPQINQVQQQVIAQRCGAPAEVQISQRNTPALFGASLIDELPEQAIIANARYQMVRYRDPKGQSEAAPVGRVLRLRNGKIGRFGWKAQSANLLDFVQAACANELGLGNPGQAQPTPLARTDYRPRGLDLTTEQCEQMAAFISSLPRPVEIAPTGAAGRKAVERGRQAFSKIGCAECHVPAMGSLTGVYSDFLLHRMGKDLVGGGSYVENPPDDDSPGADPLPDEWRTPPLWGVADSGPYMHDGRAATLAEAIKLHAGQGAASATRFGSLGHDAQNDLLQFLKSLRAPS